ncbi:MAG: hypothetical protein EOM61_10425 [Bacteroidia bacterium]|nr:hypothetical protein [Bacteroidia bacterium]
MKEIPAEKLNMVLALHYLHGLSKKQITKISGLHYTQVDSHIAKLDKQLALGELSRDDIMASAESANKRLGLEELVAKDGEKDMEVTAKKLVEEINKEASSDGTPQNRVANDFTYPITFEQTPYPVIVLNDIIDRINSKQISVTCLSICEDDFGMLSINWRSKNETK